MDGRIRHAQHLAHAQRGQRVVHAEFAGHVHLHVHLVRPRDREAHAEEILGAEQLVRARAVIGLRAAAVGHEAAGMALQQRRSVFVVDVDDAHAAPPEQLALPGAVLFKGAVFAGADMVRRKVRKHAHVVADAAHAIHHQALAGNLHQRCVAACVEELPEGFLQLVAFRRGVGGIPVRAEAVYAVGADHAHFFARRLQHAFDHVGGGRFALRARHADQRHLLCGAAEQVRAHQRHGQTSVFRAEHCHPRHGGEIDFVLDDKRRSPFGRTVRGEIMAVALGADDAEKQHPRRSFPAVVDNVRDFGFEAALYERARHALRQLRKFHRHIPLCLTPGIRAKSIFRPPGRQAAPMRRPAPPTARPKKRLLRRRSPPPQTRRRTHRFPP